MIVTARRAMMRMRAVAQARQIILLVRAACGSVWPAMGACLHVPHWLMQLIHFLPYTRTPSGDGESGISPAGAATLSIARNGVVLSDAMLAGVPRHPQRLAARYTHSKCSPPQETLRSQLTCHPLVPSRRRGLVVAAAGDCPFSWLPEAAWRRVTALGRLPSCSTLASDMIKSAVRWREWAQSSAPEQERMPLVQTQSPTPPRPLQCHCEVPGH